MQVGETVELEVVLLHDPTSIEVTGSPRASLTVTDLQPYPDGDAHLHRQVRRGAGGRAPPRPPAAPRRPGRGDRLAHDRGGRQRGPRRGRRRARAPRRRAPRPRPAARRPASGPRHLDLPRRRREGHVRLDGVRRGPRRSRPRPAERDHARGRRLRVRDPDPALDRVLRRRDGGLLHPGRTSSADRPRRPRGDPGGDPQGHRSARPHDRASGAAAHRGARRAVGAGEPRPQAEHAMGRVRRRSWARTWPSRGGRSTSTSRDPARAPPSRSERLPCSPPTTPASRVGSASRARSPRPARSRPSSPRRRRPSRPSS